MKPPVIPHGSILLSPMAGFSDSPYRRICREQGAAFSITEFVPTQHLFHSAPSALRLFRFHESERPILFQIFGNDPDIIVNAAKRIVPLNPDGIDLNMGCSTRKVSMRGSGAGLLREPKKVREIIRRLVRETKIPISAKIRLGWDANSRNYLEIADILESEGVWMMAVHGRTREMGYSGEADWNAIGEIASKVTIPVFGNGDVKSREEAHLKVARYGVHGVYIGRGAIGRPWVFRPAGGEPSPFEKREIMRHHFSLMQAFYGSAAAILFRKHLTRYAPEIGLQQAELAALLSETEAERMAFLLSAQAQENKKIACELAESFV